MLLADLLGPLGLEDPAYPLILQALSFDLLQPHHFGFRTLARFFVTFLLLLDLVLLVVELFALVLEVLAGLVVVIERGRRAVRRGGNQLVRHQSPRGRFRPLQDGDRSRPGRHEAVDRDLLDLGTEGVDLALQHLELGFEVLGLVAQAVELDPRLRVRLGRGIRPVARRLDLPRGTFRRLLVGSDRGRMAERSADAP